MRAIHFTFILLCLFTGCNSDKTQKNEVTRLQYFSKHYLITRASIYDFTEKHPDIEVIYDLKFKKTDKERSNVIVLKVPVDKIEVVNTAPILNEATFKHKNHSSFDQLNKDYGIEYQNFDFEHNRLVVFEVDYHKY